MNDFELTLLGEDQVTGPKALSIFKTYGIKAAPTDFAILTGNIISEDRYCIDEAFQLSGRIGAYWLKTYQSLWNYTQYTNCVSHFGYPASNQCGELLIGIRPVLTGPLALGNYVEKRKGYQGISEITFGEYPQYALQDREKIMLLDRLRYNNELTFTGKTYTLGCYNSRDDDTVLSSINRREYVLNREKYVYCPCLIKESFSATKLSNGEDFQGGNSYWIKVAPITWLYDEATKLLVSKRILIAGIPYFTDRVVHNFEESDIKKFMDTFMVKEIIPLARELDNSLLDENETIHNYVYWKKPTRNK